MGNCILTIALSIRLKRRVFASEGIRDAAETLIREHLKEINVEILHMEFLDYGVILTVNNLNQIPTDDIATFIRKTTSGYLRRTYPEIQRMPSLWMRKFYSETGELTDTHKTEIASYYGKIHTR